MRTDHQRRAKAATGDAGVDIVVGIDGHIGQPKLAEIALHPGSARSLSIGGGSNLLHLYHKISKLCSLLDKALRRRQHIRMVRKIFHAPPFTQLFMPKDQKNASSHGTRRFSSWFHPCCLCSVSTVLTVGGEQKPLVGSITRPVGSNYFGSVVSLSPIIGRKIH